MTNAVKRIVTAWRDEEAFDALSDSLKQEIPSHPAGSVKLRLVNTEASNNTSVFDSTNCSTSAFDCCGTSVFNTCSTSVFDCCN